jgi:hypothetical protein
VVGLPVTNRAQGSVLLGFHESMTYFGSCVTSPFIARCDRGPLPTGKGGGPDQGASWIMRETRTWSCNGPVEI